MLLRHKVLGLLIAASVGGCNPSGASQAPSQSELSAGGVLPCEVQTVFNNVCTACHGQTPLYGAPMQLLTYADTQQELIDTNPDATDHSTKEPIWQRIGERIHDPHNPMPEGNIPLAPDQMATLDNWVAAGAPQGSACQVQQGAGGGSGTGAGGYGVVGSAGGGDTYGAGGSDNYGSGGVTGGGGAVQASDAGSPPPPDPNDCTPIDILARNDASGTPFPVPAGTSNLYQCFSYHVDLQGSTQGLSFVRKIDNAQVLHHWLLYAMTDTQTNGASSACLGAHPDGALIAGWAPGGDDWILPPTVGMGLGTGDFILEIHYNNYTGVDQTDHSGVEICAAKTPRENTAGISWLGNDLFTIPASTQDAPIAGNCVPSNTTPVHVIKSWPHMHLLGTRMTATITRAATHQTETLFDEPFDFNDQVQYTFPTIINPGDTILTTCHFDNPNPYTVSFGEKTTDEMCFNFTVAYPAHTLVQPGVNSLIHADECISAAP